MVLPDFDEDEGLPVVTIEVLLLVVLVVLLVLPLEGCGLVLDISSEWGGGELVDIEEELE